MNFFTTFLLHLLYLFMHFSCRYLFYYVLLWFYLSLFFLCYSINNQKRRPVFRKGWAGRRENFHFLFSQLIFKVYIHAWRFWDFRKGWYVRWWFFILFMNLQMWWLDLNKVCKIVYFSHFPSTRSWPIKKIVCPLSCVK